MTIYLNGEAYQEADGNTLKKFINTRFTNQNGIAVAVDRQIIPFNSWEKFTLKENQQIIIIKATQGG